MDGYDRCCWQVEGQGQFRPLKGSDPYVGREGHEEHVKEWRLEMVVPEDKATQVVEALVKAHPYQVPAYHLIPVKTVGE